ncbi:MAG: Gfo/Idh/MocA family oxidoreductase [Spirochaetaceae bacterium]|nr:MAG: Gfo/Idh/MocA family oxidoreductase [Spirochaetaceae bacterium]
MAEKIGIGIIGAGFMGMLHARALSQLADVRVLAASDPALKKAPQLPGQSEPLRLYPDHRELLDNPDIHAVVIATPEDLHCQSVKDSAAAGKHILLEKPIATTLEDADAIIEAADRHKVKLMMAHLLRYDVRYAQIKTAVQDGVIGKPLVCYARRNAVVQEARRLGGRVEVEEYISVHDIDQVFWYFDDRAVKVSAEVAEGPVMKELGVHDFIWITIRFEKGGLAIVETGWGLSESIVKWRRPSSWGGFGDVCLELIGEKGSLYLDYRPMTLSAVDEEGWKFPETLHWPEMHGEVVGDVLEEDRYFVRVINGEAPIISSGQDGRNALEVVLAAQRSYREDKPVRL